jgi:hypothetical protein
MKRKILMTDSELDQFRAGFSVKNTTPLSSNYCRQAVVVGYFDDDAIVGGYILNSTAPYRYWEWLPEAARPSHALTRIVAQPATEITAIWMDKNRIDRFGRIALYSRLALDVIRHGRTYILGGSLYTKVAGIQKEVLPRIVFSGPTGLQGQPIGEIYYARKTQFVGRFVMCFLRDLGRAVAGSLAAGRDKPVHSQHA